MASHPPGPQTASSQVPARRRRRHLPRCRLGRGLVGDPPRTRPLAPPRLSPAARSRVPASPSLPNGPNDPQRALRPPLRRRVDLLNQTRSPLMTGTLPELPPPPQPQRADRSSLPVRAPPAAMLAIVASPTRHAASRLESRATRVDAPSLMAAATLDLTAVTAVPSMPRAALASRPKATRANVMSPKPLLTLSTCVSGGTHTIWM